MAATLDHDSIACRNSAGKHFTEILANHLGYDYITFAKGGCSNNLIRMQIDEAIDRGVDFVIFNTTTEPRFEFPFEGKSYDPEKGIHNFCYNNHPDRSQLYVSDENTMDSVTIRTLVDRLENTGFENKEFDRISKAAEQYLLYLYDEDYKQLMDTWAIEGAVRRLQDEKIPYLGIFHFWIPIKSRFLIKRNIRHICSFHEDKLLPESGTFNKIEEIEKCIPHLLPLTGNRRWHTDDETQVRLYEKILSYIEEYNILEWFEDEN